MNVAKNASIEFLSNMLLLFVEFPKPKGNESPKGQNER